MFLGLGLDFGLTDFIWDVKAGYWISESERRNFGLLMMGTHGYRDVYSTKLLTRVLLLFLVCSLGCPSGLYESKTCSNTGDLACSRKYNSFSVSHLLSHLYSLLSQYNIRTSAGNTLNFKQKVLYTLNFKCLYWNMLLCMMPVLYSVLTLQIRYLSVRILPQPCHVFFKIQIQYLSYVCLHRIEVKSKYFILECSVKRIEFGTDILSNRKASKIIYKEL